MTKTNPALQIGHLQFKEELAKKILNRKETLSLWYQDLCRQVRAPFATSVDIRDSGYKIAPVDTNLYPAGFNNLCPEDLRTAPPIIRAEIEFESSRMDIPTPQRILIIPEAHTQNLYYLDHLHQLFQLIQEAGFQVRIGWYGPFPPDSSGSTTLTLQSASGHSLTFHATTLQGNRLVTDQFDPDLILLNNDFSSGYPQLFEQTVQPVIPSYKMGWHTRKKSEHFRHYNRLAGEFAERIGVDPWIFQISTHAIDGVNFNAGVGIDSVSATTRTLLLEMEKEFQKRNISQKPFAFIKNNSGTYGMGIHVVHDASEVEHFNRRVKNKLAVGKNKSPVTSVVVQEGIPTTVLIDRLISEPTIYLVGPTLIGGFLRTHPEKGAEDNLNAQGMVFRKLCMADLREIEGENELDPAVLAEIPTLELVYGSIARLAAIATGFEIKEQEAKSRP